MYPSVVCVIASAAPLKKPSRTSQQRCAYCETRCSWAKRHKETEAIRTRILRQAVEAEQRSKRHCFPANISISESFQPDFTSQRLGTIQYFPGLVMTNPTDFLIFMDESHAEIRY